MAIESIANPKAAYQGSVPKADSKVSDKSSREQKKSWGSNSGSRQYYEQRNNKIVALYGKGICIDELCEEFHLSYDTIRKIIKTNL